TSVTFVTVALGAILLFTMSKITHLHGSRPPRGVPNSFTGADMILSGRKMSLSRLLEFNNVEFNMVEFKIRELKSRLQDPDWWSQTGSNRRPPACKAGA